MDVNDIVTLIGSLGFPIAVSYTHLDVYKRQIALNMNNADNVDIAGNGSLVHVASNVFTKYFVFTLDAT